MSARAESTWEDAADALRVLSARFSDVVAELYEWAPAPRLVGEAPVVFSVQFPIVAGQARIRLGIVSPRVRHLWLLSQLGTPFLVRLVTSYDVVASLPGEEPASRRAMDLPHAASFGLHTTIDDWLDRMAQDISAEPSVAALRRFPT